MKDNVQHPKHYTSHPSGVECIEVVRHYRFPNGNSIKYVWRAGLKDDASLSTIEKEKEDIDKSIWYIDDRISQLRTERCHKMNLHVDFVNFEHPSGYNIDDIAGYYNYFIGKALECLWYTGLVEYEITVPKEIELLEKAKNYLKRYKEITFTDSETHNKKEIITD